MFAPANEAPSGPGLVSIAANMLQEEPSVRRFLIDKIKLRTAGLIGPIGSIGWIKICDKILTLRQY